MATRYLSKCWDTSISKKDAFLNFISYQKFIFWWKFSSYMSALNLSKKSLLTVSCSIPWSERLLDSFTMWGMKYFNFVNVSIGIMYKTNSFCQILRISRALVCSAYYHGFDCFCWSILTSSFRSFIVVFCSLIWLLSDIASSEVLFKYGTSIFRYISPVSPGSGN